MLRYSLLLLRDKKGTRPLWRRVTSKQRDRPDRGMLAHGDKQDTRLTDPSVYHSRDQQDMLRTARATADLRERMESGAHSSSVGATRAEALRDFDDPRTPDEEVVAARFDARAIGLRDSSREDMGSERSHRDQSVHGVTAPVPAQAIANLRWDEDRRREIQLQFPMMPSLAKQRKLEKGITQDDADEQRALRMRDRLGKEFGVFNPQRMDAYMLDDESGFPKWVRDLAPSIRDRVMFGGLGITEQEEAQRESLLRLPREQREGEWQRLKAAKSHELGEERLLSPAEVLASRMMRRKSKALLRKRRSREATLRQLQLREPEKWQAEPIGKVDYSARLAVVARHVEANVQTKGQWPLSDEHLEKAKVRQLREQAKASPLERVSSDFMTTMDRVSPAMREALLAVGRKEPVVRRVSRRNYAFRLNAVRNGHQDEHGRRFQDISRQGRQRFSRAQTAEEVELERGTARRRRPNERGQEAPFTSAWPAKYDTASRAFEADPRTISGW